MDELRNYRSAEPDAVARLLEDVQRISQLDDPPLYPDLPGSTRSLAHAHGDAARSLDCASDDLHSRSIGAPWTVTGERSSLTRRVGTAELAHRLVELLGPFKLADMAGAGNHYEGRVRDGPLKVASDAER
jgi:hypothetical protein